ncbi:PAS domain-containing serine/threonine-protein kinase [Fasciola gigantica]|uniref:PAS domain-containing serine/threonine-protein kinase n=1 Tax=Fasciola gigantica TaxID=46835 RepID=A0A504YED7_FASGI|nr:PAS domain-containing serine/threonine-protein kinase [Fasciola gigantica]
MVCSWIAWLETQCIRDHSGRQRSSLFDNLDVPFLSWSKIFRWQNEIYESVWDLFVSNQNDTDKLHTSTQSGSESRIDIAKQEDELLNRFFESVGDQNNSSIVISVTNQENADLVNNKRMSNEAPSESNIVLSECVSIKEVELTQRMEVLVEELSNLDGESLIPCWLPVPQGRNRSYNTMLANPLWSLRLNAAENLSESNCDKNESVQNQKQNNQSCVKLRSVANEKRSDPGFEETTSVEKESSSTHEAYPPTKPVKDCPVTSSCDQPPTIDGVQNPPKASQDIETFCGNYKMTSTIGRGAFGFVRSGVYLRNGRKVVIKVIRGDRLPKDNLLLVPREELIVKDQMKEEVNEPKFSFSLYRQYKDLHNRINLMKSGETPDDFSAQQSLCHVPREIWILKQIRHPHVVQMVDWVNDGRANYFLVMAPHGLGMDLFEFIDRRPTIDEPLGSYMFRQLVSAVAYLHSIQLAHRDIKDENLLIDEMFQLKLIDFGSAIPVAMGSKLSGVCGTTEYCSPEILTEKAYDPFSADIWAMGITLHTLMTGENPFTTREEILLCELNLPSWMSKSLRQTLSGTLEPNYRKRMTVKELEQFPWVKQEVHIEKYNFNSVLKDTSFHGNISADFRKYTPESTVLKNI